MRWPVGKQCPSPVALERGYWEADPAVAAHVDGCARCAPAWREIVALVELGSALPAPLPPARAEELRTTLLARPTVAASPRRRVWPWLAPVVAAAAVALLWWRWPAPAAEVPARAVLLAHGEARYLERAGESAPLVRLVDGTLTVGVPAGGVLVVVGDAEVSAPSGTFDVSARADRLVAVRVLVGGVEVRGGVGEAKVLRAGETWTATATAAEPAAAAATATAAEPATATAAAPATATAAEPATATATAAEPATAAATATQRAAPRPRPEPPPPPAPAPVIVSVEPDAAPPAPERGPDEAAFAEGWARIRAGDFLAAAAAFETAARLGDDPRLREDATYWRAVALARAAHVGEAVRAFERFLAEHPSSVRHGEAGVALGWLLVERGDLDGARVRFRAAAGDPSARVRTSAEAGLRALE